jgi:hypothetical protein
MYFNASEIINTCKDLLKEKQWTSNEPHYTELKKKGRKEHVISCHLHKALKEASD